MEKYEDYFHVANFTDQKGQLRTTRVPVVQELVRSGLQQLPERFISVPPDQPISQAISVVDGGDQEERLPIIDMVKLRVESDPDCRGRELAKLASGSKEWGMFLIANHGVHNSVLDGVEDVVKGFFDLSFEEKKASVGSYMSVDNMGYGRNFVKSEDQPLDWIDRLTMVASSPSDEQQLLLNVWPQTPPNFRQMIEKYVYKAKRICDDLLRHLAEALTLHRNAFLQQFEPETSELKVRINYYPPCPRPDLAMGLTPHSDASGLTLLIQFESSQGLQVFKNMRWMTVPWPRDTLLVNIGDLMEIMSNGQFISPWHRAITQTNVERYSVAVFYNPPPDVVIEPIQNEKFSEMRYKKVIVKEYLEQFYKLSPTPTKQAIMYAKVE